MLACLMGLSKTALKGRRILSDAGIPTYLFPESSAHAMRALWRVGQHVGRDPAPPLIRLDTDVKAAQSIVQEVRDQNRKVLSLQESLLLMMAYGVKVLPYESVTDVEEALAAAEKLTFPLVAKLDEPDLVHKTESGGVIADIRDEAALVHAVQNLRDIARTHRQDRDADDETVAAPVHVILQQMARGHETIIGMTTDPTLGPLLLFGYGGIYVEIIRDIAFHLHPVGEVQALKMIRRISAYPLLSGARGDERRRRPAIYRLYRRRRFPPRHASGTARHVIRIDPYRGACGRPGQMIRKALAMASRTRKVMRGICFTWEHLTRVPLRI